MAAKRLKPDEVSQLLKLLRNRFEKNDSRHKEIKWEALQSKLEANAEKLWSLNQMEITGGEPDVIGFDKKENVFIFCDCATESPIGRRSLCYDRQALDARKANKPLNSAMDLAKEMGIEMLNETQYEELQRIGSFDMKTSSWLETPSDVRKAGGAIFGDRRFGRVFVYHNGADSYYAARGFRGILKI